MQRSATRTGPGMLRSPFSHRRTVRRSLSSASAAACCVGSPAARRAALNSSGVMPHQPNLAAQAVRTLRLGNQVSVDERAVRVLDGVSGEHVGQRLGGHVSSAFLPNFPAFAAIHLDTNLSHGGLLSDGQKIGPLALNVNGDLRT